MNNKFGTVINNGAGFLLLHFRRLFKIAGTVLPASRRTTAKAVLDFSEHDIFVRCPNLPPARGKTLPACRKNYLRHILNYLWDILKYVWDNFSGSFYRREKNTWQKCQVGKEICRILSFIIFKRIRISFAVILVPFFGGEISGNMFLSIKCCRGADSCQ